MDEYKKKKMPHVNWKQFQSNKVIPHKITDYVWELIRCIINHDQFVWKQSLSSNVNGTDIIFYLVQFQNGFDIFFNQIIKLNQFHYDYTKRYESNGVERSLLDIALLHKNKKAIIPLLQNGSIPSVYTSSIHQCKLIDIATELKFRGDARKYMINNLFIHLKDEEDSKTNYETIQHSWIDHGYSSVIGTCCKVKLNEFIERKVISSPIYPSIQRFAKYEFCDNNEMYKFYQIISLYMYYAYSINGHDINGQGNKLFRKSCEEMMKFHPHQGLIIQLMLYGFNISKIWSTVQNRYHKHYKHLYKICLHVQEEKNDDNFQINFDNDKFLGISVPTNTCFNHNILNVGDIVFYKQQCAEIHTYFNHQCVLISYPSGKPPGSRERTLVTCDQIKVNFIYIHIYMNNNNFSFCCCK